MASAAREASIDAGRVLGRAFETLKANFLLFYVIAILLAGLPGFFNAYLAYAHDDTTDPNPYLSIEYWGSLLGWFLGIALLQAVLARATILHLSGRRQDPAGSVMLVLRLLPPLTGLSFYVLFLILIGLICLIIPGIMIYCALMVVVPALVEERRGLMGSIDRSRELTRGSRFQIFLVALLFWIFSFVISGVVGVISGDPWWSTAPSPNPLLSAAADGFAASLNELICAVTIATLYVELREVKEGAGAEQLTGVFG